MSWFGPCPAGHQLAFLTPGMQPVSASFRKQIRHVPNLRYTARGRPHSMQRRTARVEYFGFRAAAAIFDLLALVSYASPSPSFFRGIPIARRNSRASSSLRADVTSVMFIPCGRVYLSGLISGKTICSESPRL